MSKEIVQVLQDQLERRTDELAKMAPAGWGPKRVNRAIKCATMAVADNGKLLSCKPASIIMAVYKAVEIGLDVTSAQGHAYLVPYGAEARLQIGYRGMIELALRTGKVMSITADAVHENDVFEWEQNQIGLHFRHAPPWDERGPIVGVYAIAHLKTGGSVGVRMSTDEIEQIRSRSKTGSSGPWRSDWSEMAKKTAIRRLWKFLPSSSEMALAEELDNDNVGLDAAPLVQATGSRADQLTAQIETREADVVDVEPMQAGESEGDTGGVDEEAYA